MRRKELMTAAGVTLAGLGVLVGLAIGSGGSAPAVVQRAQPVEVRTEVIHRTINVYRKAKPPKASGTGSGGSAGRSSAVLTASAPAGATYTPRTRSSGASSSSPSYSSAPTVTTRSSGGAAKSGGGSSAPVSTRSSGGGGNGGGDGGGGHDD